MKSLKVLCLVPFDNVAMVYLDMIELVKDKIKINPTFILPFDDKYIENILTSKNYRYIRISKNWINKFGWIPIPLIRIFIKEIFFYKIYKQNLKYVLSEEFDYFFCNYNSNEFEKYILRFFKRRMIPSLLYDYGIGPRNPRGELLTKNDYRYGKFMKIVFGIEKNIYLFIMRAFSLVPQNYNAYNINCDYILVREEIDKLGLIKYYKVDKDRIKVVGSVTRGIIDNKYIQYSGSSSKVKNLLIILSDGYRVGRRNEKQDGWKYFHYLDKLLSSICNSEKANDVNIILKHHPKDILYLYDDLKEKFKNKVTWYKHKQKDTLLLISRSDLIITQLSTVLHDILYLGKNMLFYDFAGTNYIHESYVECFDKYYYYDLNKSIYDNFELSKNVKVNDNILSKHVSQLSFADEFSMFLILTRKNN